MCFNVPSLYLLLNSVSLGHHGVEVVTFGNTVEHQLLDLHLQVGIGALQRTHLEDDRESFKPLRSIRECRLAANIIVSLPARCQTKTHLSLFWLRVKNPNRALLCCVSDLVQVVRQAVVETLHSLLVIGAVAVETVEREADRAVEVLAYRGRTSQRAGCGEGHRSTGASAAGVHQGTTGERWLPAHGVTPQ